jgi:AcrR family transcriptional regulator
MSEKPPATERKVDRRVQRTHHSLGDALIELMRVKPFASITVQEVLDRAHVSRSTFYMHYRNKDDLFLSDVDHFFERMAGLLAHRGEASNRVAPVRELFAHVADWSDFYSAMKATGKAQEVQELAEGHFARGIEQRLAGLAPTAAAAPRAAQAHALAGALLSLLSWWIARGRPLSPAQMDDTFHQIVWSGVSVAADQKPPR